MINVLIIHILWFICEEEKGKEVDVRGVEKGKQVDKTWRKCCQTKICKHFKIDSYLIKLLWLNTLLPILFLLN